MIDALAAEYGWSIDYIISQPMDIIGQLLHALLVRKGAHVKRKQYQVDPESSGFLDRIKGILGKIDTSP